MLAVSCTDGVHKSFGFEQQYISLLLLLMSLSHAGSFSLFNASGRRDKQIKAHKGAVTSLRWNIEGMLISVSGSLTYQTLNSAIHELPYTLTERQPMAPSGSCSLPSIGQARYSPSLFFV